MKKSEFIQFTKIIEHLVAKEIRKQLPSIMTETLHNITGKKNLEEYKKQDISNKIKEEINESVSSEEIPNNLNTSLRELFSSTGVVESLNIHPKELKRFAKDPILNQILNETVSDLQYKDRSVGNAALIAGYTPFESSINNNTVDFGKVMSEMNSTNQSTSNMSELHIPLESLPKDLSVLDMTKYAPPVVQKALTRNYSEMMKMIDKKRGKI